MLPKFISNIDHFLAVESNSVDPIAPKTLISYLAVHTGLSEKQCQIIITNFFKEILFQIFDGKRISFEELGDLFLTKNNIFKFKASKRLKSKLNENRKIK